MKKLIVLILSLILCISMFGCSGSEQSTLDKYVSELGLKDSWVTTMEEHIPEFDTLESLPLTKLCSQMAKDIML